MSDVHHLPALFVRQRITLLDNRYEVLAANSDGKPGELLALAEQGQAAFAAGASFFADEARSRPVFTYTAREPGLVEAGFAVIDGSGAPLGHFKREYSTSFLRNVYHLETSGLTGTGMERSNVVALAKRFTDTPFLPVHYDFTTPEEQPLMSVERRRRVRDLYVVTVPDPRVDFRFAAAVAVAVDVLLNR